MQAFYLNGLLRALFLALTSIFVPLYVYTLGLKEFGTPSAGLLLTAGYFMAQRVAVVTLVIPVSRVVENLGFRKSITLSALFLICYMLSMLQAETSLTWLWVSAVWMGANIPMYWISRDSALSQDIEGRSMGEKMANISALDNVAGLAGPFAGGVVVAFWGYSTLFGVALAVLLLSVLPLWWMAPHRHKNGVSLAGFWYFLTNGRYYHQALANFGSAINDYGNGVIWPLVLFFQGIRDKTLGAVYSLAALVTIAVQLLSGRWFDKLRARDGYADEGVYGLSSLGVLAAWILRILATGLTQVLTVDLGRQVFATLHANFYTDYMHLGGRRMGSIAFWVYMEIMYSLGAIVIFGVMTAGIYFGVWKELTLLTVAVWSLAMLSIARESNLR